MDEDHMLYGKDETRGEWIYKAGVSWTLNPVGLLHIKI